MYRRFVAPEKDHFSVFEIAEQFSVRVDDVRHHIRAKKLRLAFPRDTTKEFAVLEYNYLFSGDDLSATRRIGRRFGLFG